MLLLSIGKTHRKCDALFKHASKFYGGPAESLPYKSKQPVIALQEICDSLQELSLDRNGNITNGQGKKGQK